MTVSSWARQSWSTMSAGISHFSMWGLRGWTGNELRAQYLVA